jgi:hypothetical protein
MSRWYILNNNNKPIPASTLEAVKWLEEGSDRRTVKRDEIGDIIVSTVFLQLDHSWTPGGKPVLWETMIFGGEHDQYQERYTSHKDALKGHEKALTLITKE